MIYRIEYTPTAVKHLDRITQADRIRIIKKIDLLAKNPFLPGSKVLKGFDGFYRIRVGDYRVIYAVRRSVITVTIVAIGQRGDIYKRISTLLK